MEVAAYIKYLRTSPKKMEGWGRAIKGLSASQAVERLQLGGDKAGRLLVWAVKSAIANAKNNSKLDPAKLFIKNVEVLKGPFFKRFQPVSRGMAHPIKKRTAHVKVVLEERKADSVKRKGTKE